MFTYEQVMDMRFPVPDGEIKDARMMNRHNQVIEIGDMKGEQIKGMYGNGYSYSYVPTLDEVYNSLRSGLCLKCLGRPERDSNFQFWLSDPGFDDKFYASGKTLADAICNAYIRGKHRPTNP